MAWYYWVIVSIVILLLLLWEAIALKVVKGIVNPRRHTRADQIATRREVLNYDKDTKTLNNTPLQITLKDGYVIRGDFNLVPHSNKFCILTHGHGSTREEMRHISTIYRDLGFSTLIYDLRGHGDNEKTYVTMGYRESADLNEIIAYTKEKFGNDIIYGLHGISMGAATVMLTTKYRSDARFIVEDCGYASTKEEIADLVRKEKFNPRFVLPLVDAHLKLFYRFSFADASPIDAIKNSDIPLLIIHGGADDFINVKHAYLIKEAAKGYSQIVIVSGAVHATSFAVDQKTYRAAIREFLATIKIC